MEGRKEAMKEGWEGGEVTGEKGEGKGASSTSITWESVSSADSLALTPSTDSETPGVRVSTLS